MCYQIETSHHNNDFQPYIYQRSSSTFITIPDKLKINVNPNEIEALTFSLGATKDQNIGRIQRNACPLHSFTSNHRKKLTLFSKHTCAGILMFWLYYSLQTHRKLEGGGSLSAGNQIQADTQIYYFMCCPNSSGA